MIQAIVCGALVIGALLVWLCWPLIREWLCLDDELDEEIDSNDEWAHFDVLDGPRYEPTEKAVREFRSGK